MVVGEFGESSAIEPMRSDNVSQTHGQQEVGTVMQLSMLQCPGGSIQVGSINADVAGCGLTPCESRHASHNIEQCRHACAVHQSCKAFTWAPIGGDRNTLDKPICSLYDVDQSNAVWGPNQVMCKLTDELWCPAGTTQVGQINADIWGCGLTRCEDRYFSSTVEDCRAECAAEKACNSISWAPIGGDKNHLDKNVCTLYNLDSPTGVHGPKQIFCKWVRTPPLAQR